MVEVENLVFHELEFPTRILSATHTDGRSPLLKVYFYNNEGVHAFEETGVRVVSQMSLDQVQFQKTESADNWANHSRWPFHYHLSRLSCDELVHDLRVELRCEVNPAGGFSPEKQFKPLRSASWYCEKVDPYRHIS